MNIVTDGNYCVKCHAVADFQPQGDPYTFGPNLADVYRRLRPKFTRDWIANPVRILPYTGMPVNIPYHPTDPSRRTASAERCSRHQHRAADGGGRPADELRRLRQAANVGDAAGASRRGAARPRRGRAGGAAAAGAAAEAGAATAADDDRTNPDDATQRTTADIARMTRRVTAAELSRHPCNVLREHGVDRAMDEQR